MVRRAFVIDGAKVRELRELLGISQEELAERCGITQPMVSYIENGTRNPRPGVLGKLARGLGVPVATIASRTSEQVAS